MIAYALSVMAVFCFPIKYLLVCVVLVSLNHADKVNLLERSNEFASGITIESLLPLNIYPPFRFPFHVHVAALTTPLFPYDDRSLTTVALSPSVVILLKFIIRTNHESYIG